MNGYRADDRFLFWLANVTGASIDKLYASRLVRISMMVLAYAEGKLSKDPR